VTLWGIAEHFRAKTPPASVFEEEALPSQVTRTSDETWSNQPGAIATGQRSEPLFNYGTGRSLRESLSSDHLR
jgi:hypothetical protein